jgi:protein-tyrosine phosphatase
LTDLAAYPIPAIASGELAIVACPQSSMLGAWVHAVHARYTVLVSLLAARDVEALGLHEEGARYQALGGRFVAYPIDDYSVPSDLDSFVDLVERIHGALAMGQGVAVHCRGGIGRSGLVASAVLIRDGRSLESAVARVARSRGHPVPETAQQRRWLAGFAEAITDRKRPPT